MEENKNLFEEILAENKTSAEAQAENTADIDVDAALNDEDYGDCEGCVKFSMDDVYPDDFDEFWEEDDDDIYAPKKCCDKKKCIIIAAIAGVVLAAAAVVIYHLLKKRNKD